MVYGKRTYRKKKAYRKPKKSWYNRKYSALQLASKVLAGVRYMKGMINCEKKYHTISQNTTFSTTGVCTYLSAIPQGDTAVQREGNSVLCRSIHVKDSIVKNTNALTTKCKIALVLDTGYGDNAASMAANLVWDSTYIGTSYAPLAPMQLNTQGRYKIIKVWEFTLTANSNTRLIDEYIKIYKHIKFDGTGSTASDLSKNAFYLFHISDQDTNVPTLELINRIGFYDN